MNFYAMDTLDWREVKIDWDAITEDIIKAGTPMSREGKAANDGSCYGILMDDVQRKRNKAGRVMISGRLDFAQAEAHSGVALSEEAKAALPDVWDQGGSGGVSSWNDLTDKPFGKDTVHSDTLTWDGNTEGLVSVDNWYKVSDAKVSMDDLANGFVVRVAGRDTPMPAEAVSQLVDGVLIIAGSWAAFVSEEGVGVSFDEGLAFEEAGVYFMCIPGTPMCTEALTIPDYTGFIKTEVKRIDPEFLPEGMGVATRCRQNVTWDWDLDTNGRTRLSYNGLNCYYKIADSVPPFKNVESALSKGSNGDTSTDLYEGENCYRAGGAIAVTTAGQCKLAVDEGDAPIAFTAPAPGLYAINRADNGYNVWRVTMTFVEERSGIGLIVRSGEFGSEKLFKIYVNDNGHVNAVECDKYGLEISGSNGGAPV